MSKILRDVTELLKKAEPKRKPPKDIDSWPVERRPEMDLSCTLTKDEIIEKSKVQSHALLEIDDCKAKAKAAADDYKHQVAAHEATVDRYKSQINSGFEYRPVNCWVEFNYPIDGFKTIYRSDTQAPVRVIMMTEDEQQKDLFADTEKKLTAKEKAAPKKAAPKKAAAKKAAAKKQPALKD